MTKAANRYIHAIIVLGALLLPYCLYRVIGDLNAANLATELLQMGCLVAICAVCRSLPIYITPHHAIDVSILAIITAVLLRGPYQAVIVYLLSSLCSVDLETGGEKKAHLYNTPIKKSAFNNANLLLSILIPGLLIQACGHVAGDVILLYLIPIALAIGYVRGGRLRNYIERPLRGIGLPCVAFLLEAALSQVPKWTGLAPEMSLMLCVVAEYALLTLFCGLNMDRFGMKGVAAGVALNMLVIFANGFRMPVGAIARSIPALAETVARIDSGELLNERKAPVDRRKPQAGAFTCL